MIETIDRRVKARQAAGQPWTRGIVQGVAGSLATVTLDGEQTARPNIPVAPHATVAAGDYVAMMRFDEFNLLIVAKIPV